MAKEVLRPTDADAVRLARTLLRSARHAALAVAEPGSAWPLASRVSVATDLAGRPLILVSTLSAHTGALVDDPRCALLLGEPGKGDPLAHPRMTLRCRAERVGPDHVDRAALARRFLNRHPKAKLYADFSDFAYFRLEPIDASLNGGFGRAHHMAAADLLSDTVVAADLEAGEQRAVEHMNDDHRDAIAHYARHHAGSQEDRDWRLSGIDPDGVDIVAGDAALRVFFPVPLASAGDMRAALVALARDGRAL